MFSGAPKPFHLLDAPKVDASVGLAGEAEKARQQSILQATGSINNSFDSAARQKQYSDYGTALKDYYNTDLTRQHDIAARTLKFAIARGGNTGGSVAVDKGRMLGDEYAAGVLNATRDAQHGVDALRGADEASRSSLISMAQGGLSLGNTNGFNSALVANRNTAANIAPQALGDVFSGVGSYVQRSQSQKDQQDAYNRTLYGQPTGMN